MSESQITEWKLNWSDKYLKWLCGFANAQGGVLEIGRNDRGEVVGIDNSDRLMEELPNKLRDLLGIMAEIDLLNEHGRSYLRITVEPYDVPISYRGEYRYRSGSTKQVLRGAALNRFLLRKTGKRWDGVPTPNVGLNHLDESTLARFRMLATRTNRLAEGILQMGDSELIEKLRLTENKLLKRAAVLLFHPDPEQFFTAASIKIGYFESETEVLFHDEVSGNLFAQISKVMDLLRTKYLKAVISYEGIQRIETFPVPEDALREAMLNAIVHRDYAIPAQIQIRVYDDRLSIWNPGDLPEDWTVRELLGPHSSRPYNPDIANTFFRAGEIESWGRGIQRIFASCRKVRSPEPEFQVGRSDFWIKFKFSDSYVNQLTSRSVNEGISDTSKIASKVLPAITQEITQEITQDQENTQEITQDQEITQEITQENTQENIIALLRKQPDLTHSELATKVGITSNSAKYYLVTLRKAGRIRRVGSTKKGHWEVIESDLIKTPPTIAQEIAQENTQEKVVALLREHPNLTHKKLATVIGVTPDSIKYHLDKLREAGRIRHVGPTKKGHWEVIENDIDRSE